MNVDVLVIGKSGQLARCLFDCATNASELRFEFWGRETLDFAATTDIAARIESRAPDIVINAAAYTAVDKAEEEPDLAMKVNGYAPGEIAKGAAACNAAIIHVSTDYVFDGLGQRPYSEDDETNPSGVYGRTKLAGERAVAQATSRHLIIRTSWVYSPYGNNFIKTMLRLGAERDNLNVVSDQIGCPTSATDLAQFIVGAIPRLGAEPENAEIHGVLNAAGSGIASWYDLAGHVFRCAKKFGRSIPDLSPILTADYPTPATRPANSRLDMARMRRVFGTELPVWERSVERDVELLVAG